MDRSYKRKNNYYKPGGGGSNNWNNKKKFRNYLQTGMKGFICTCNVREKDCIRESYNILNEYADKLYGLEEVPAKAQTNDDKAEDGGGDTEGDIEDELKKEVSSLKANQWRNPSRFNAVDTGVKSNVFIKTTLEDPVKLALTILNDIAATKTQKARFLLRIVPVEVTCKANLDDIKSAADSLFDKHFRCEPTTFAVIVNKRYNESLLRDELIHAVALLVTDKNREHKANLKDAKKTVLLEIMKGICCISVLDDYKKLRHYNLAELAKPESADEGKSETAAGSDRCTDETVDQGGELSDVAGEEEQETAVESQAPECEMDEDHQIEVKVEGEEKDGQGNS